MKKTVFAAALVLLMMGMGSALSITGVSPGEKTWSPGENLGLEINTTGKDSANALNGTYQGETLHDGSINGASWTDSGRYGKALSFDGTDDYVNMGDKTDFEIEDGESKSISFSFKTDDNSKSGQVFLMDAAELAYDPLNPPGYAIGYTGSSLKLYSSNGSATENQVFGPSVQEDTWYDVTAVFDRSNDEIRIFVDGSQEASASFLQGSFANSHELILGRESGNTRRYLDGDLDNVQIYDKALTTSEGSDIHQSNKNIRDGKVLHLRMDHGAGSTAYDTRHRVGQYNSNNINGDAVSFDGNDDSVNAKDVDISGNLSFFAWVKSNKASNTGDARILSKDFYTQENTYELYLDDGGEIGCFLNDGVYHEIQAGSYGTSWNHIGCSYNGSHLILWKNGQKIKSVKDDVNLGTNNKDLLIGSADQNFYHNGSVDDVRVYNRSLSSSEINEIYQNDKPIQDGLVAWYTFDNATNEYADSRGLNILDYNIIPKVKLDVQRDGSSIVSDAFLTLQDWTDLDNGFQYNINNVTTLQDSSIYESTISAFTKTSTSSQNYDIDLENPDVQIQQPQENQRTKDSTGINLNYTVQDYSPVSCEYSKDGGTNFSMSSCGNTTIQFGSIGDHNLTVYASDTLGNTGSQRVGFYVDVLNKITAEVQSSGSSIDNFEATITNGTKTIGGTTENGSFQFYTSEMPKGDIDVTVKADGFQTVTREYSGVDDSFDSDLSFSLERAGFAASVFDEQNNVPINRPVLLEIRNDTATKEIVWGNQFINSGVDDPEYSVDKAGDSFDGDKTSKASIGSEITTGSTKTVKSTFTGDVSLGSSGSEELKVRYDNDYYPNVNNVRYARIYKIEAEKNGNFETIYENTEPVQDSKEDEPLQTKSFNINNTQEEYSGRIRVTAEMQADDSYNSGTFELYEVWANNLDAPSFQYPNYPTGETQITVKDNAPNQEYRQRKYLATLDQNSKINLKAFLLKQGEGIITTIEVRGPNNNALENTLLSVQRNLEGLKSVAQAKTSSDGSASFYLSPDTSYQAVASNPGYESFSGSFNPANYQYDPLLIRLGDENNFTRSTEWDVVEYKLEPKSSRLNLTGMQRFNFSVIDPEGELQEAGIKVFDESGNILDQDTVTGSPAGMSSEIDFNLSNYDLEGGSRLKAQGYFVKEDKTFEVERSFSLRKHIIPGITSLSNIFDRADPLGEGTKGLIALMTSILVGSSIKSRAGNKGAGLLTLSVLGVFVMVGWFNSFFFLITLFMLVGLYGTR